MLRVFGKLGQGMKVGESVAVTLESSAESPDALRVSLNDHEWPREKEQPAFSNCPGSNGDSMVLAPGDHHRLLRRPSHSQLMGLGMKGRAGW